MKKPNVERQKNMSNKKVYLISMLIFIILVTCFAGYNNFKFREGKILCSSESKIELLDEVPQLSFLEGNIKTCNWYQQIANKSGLFFVFTESCFSGEAVLKDELFSTILTKYSWVEFVYSKNISLMNVDYNEGMFNISMIKNSLESEKLYICHNATFRKDNYYTFLNKNTKTLYFYYLQT